MAMDPDSVSVVSKLADWIVALIGGVATLAVSGISWLYNSLARRVAVLESTSMKKADFERYEDRADVARAELREGIIALHRKVEASSADLENKVDKVIQFLLEHKDDKPIR